MHRAHPTRSNQPGDELAVAALGGEIDRRRRPVLAPATHRSISRAAEPARRAADQQYLVARRLEADRGGRVTSATSPTPPIAGVGNMPRPMVSL